MGKMLALVLVIVLLASAVPLAITPAAAYEEKIPFAGEDNELTKEELVNDAILPYMLGKGDLKLDDVGDAAYVYAHWDGKPKTITDTVGRGVTIYRPMERLVLTHPHTLETLRSIKVPKDIIVGYATQKMDTAFFPEFSDVPSIGWRWTPTVEEIIKLKPDAVILFGRAHVNLDPVQDVLESSGITVLRFCCNNRNIYPVEVEKLGYIFDKQGEAEEFLDWRENILNSIKEKVENIPEEDKTKVYFETGFGDESYSVYGMYNYADIAMAGGNDIFDEEVNGAVNPEAVVDRKPDIIIKLASWEVGGYSVDADDTAELEKVKAEIMSRDILQNVTAVKDKRVYMITVHLVSFYPVSGCKDSVKVAYMAKWFHQEHHPELFEDLDPKAIHQEYLTRFQGLDIDLDEKGVFVYPEEPI